jgi:glycosyltransferase involved in cell wall biosynthesis
VIHNWADCRAIAPVSKDNAFTREHRLGDRFVLMHSGNVGLSQNLDVLVDAAALLGSTERLVIAIVGDGARRASLEDRVRARGVTNVRFFPYQSKEQLRESFGAADAFLVSLKPGLEGFIVPSKLYGILAAGRPYIAATDPSAEPAVLAQAQGCGLWANPGDPRALAAAVAWLHDNPSATAAMGVRSRAAAFQFDRRAAVGAYVDLFARLARKATAA